MDYFRKYITKHQPFKSSFFRLPKYTLNFLGYWPEDQKSLLLSFLKFINFISLAYSSCGAFVYGTIHLNNPILALESICPSITQIVTLFKLFLFHYKKRSINKLIKSLRITLEKEIESDSEKLQIYQSIAPKATAIPLFLWTSGLLTEVFYVSRPLFENLMQLLNGKNITKILPFNVAIPDVGYDYPYFVFIFIIVSYSGIITVYGFGCDGTFFGFCLYISIAFKYIQIDIKRLLSSVKDDEQQCENVENWNKLKNIAIKHNEVISLTEELISTFSTMIMVHFISAAIAICLALIELLLARGINIFLYAGFVSAVLLQLFGYCTGGTYVMESSTSIANILYFTDWYKCDKRLRRMILFIMMRSQKGTPIRVPFFVPSLQAFGTILRTAGSYIALLKTII